jgi:hypothetical protein
LQYSDREWLTLVHAEHRLQRNTEQGKSCDTTLEGARRIQEKISGSATSLKLYMAIDEDLKSLQP